MKLVVSLFLILGLKCYFCDGYKILTVFPMPAPSHYNLGKSLSLGLAQAGHDVTIISPFQEKEVPKNYKYREIVLTGFKEKREADKSNFFELMSNGPAAALIFMNFVGNEVTNLTFSHPNVQKLLKSGETFDAVIVEQFVNDGMKVFAYHFKAPLILFSTIGANAWVNPLVGNPSPPSYVPDIFLSYASNMTFMERVKNTLFTVYSELNRHLILFPSQNRLVQQYFPGAPDLSELNYNVSLVFLNAHISTNQPVPLVPCMINIGGFHCKPPKPLPKDLKEFIDNAKDGVIYFSMGSNLKSTDLPKEKLKNLLKVFGKLKQKIIWKFEDEKLEGKPSNLMISKWLPQQDILAHPNVKLFITHGGLLSTTETIYNGVPVLAIPIFGDQKINAAEAKINGYGLVVDIEDLGNEDLLNTAINELISNKKYKKNALRRSKIMHDQPIKPLESAIFWTEYVIRHKGAVHLRVGGIDLPLYKYLLLDVVLFISTLSIVFIVLTLLLCSRLCCRSSKKNKVKKN